MKKLTKTQTQILISWTTAAVLLYVIYAIAIPEGHPVYLVVNAMLGAGNVFWYFIYRDCRKKG